MSSRSRALIVGDRDDLHVSSVVEAIGDTSAVAVIDVSTVGRDVRLLPSMDLKILDFAMKDGDLSPTRGWIRRVAPSGWDMGVTLGSHKAALLASRLALLAAVMRDPHILYLTAVEDQFAAENKIHQYRGARSLGLSIPKTVVANSIEALRQGDLGEPFIAKPLGPGSYLTEDATEAVVYAEQIDIVACLNSADLAVAPFLFQEKLSAENHLRIVTVGHQSWTCYLNAEGAPLDWRTHQECHESFQITDSYGDVAAMAVQLAATLRCGFTSQDWIVTADGAYFIDLNPAGQWLFLPEPVGSQVSSAIAAHLAGKSA